MANIEITNVDLGSSLLESEGAADGTIAFGGADVLVDGTILARDTSNDKFQIYAKDGVTNGNGIPVAILTYELEATGAGDLPIRVVVAGRFRKERLVIDADGDDQNIDGQVRDELQQTGLVAIDTEQLAQLDNQP